MLLKCTPKEDAGVLNYTQRTPIGVAGLISPWNLPLYLLSFKIAPALMSGNTVVCKPSEVTSYTAWMLCQVFHDIGLPKGVLNLVCGYGKFKKKFKIKLKQDRVDILEN